MKYPKRVKRLAAKDICKGSCNGPDGTHCLGQWVFTEFGESQDGSVVYDDIQKFVKDRYDVGCIPAFNDTRNRKKSTIAAVWNRAMKSLGYKLAKNGKYFYMPKKKVA